MKAHWLWTFLLLLLPSLGCSKIPQGRSAVDAITIINAKSLSADEIKDKLVTQSSAKFLFLFQGVAFDYSIFDEATLQRDMARVERFYRSKGFLDAHARVAHVRQVKKNHVRVEIVVDEGKPVVNRNITLVGLGQMPKNVADAAKAAVDEALPRGAHFDEDQFKNSEGALKKAFTDLGYAYATVDSQAELDVGAHTADYGFRVVPGPLALFGPITITGLDPDGNGPRQQEIPEAPMRRAIDITPGSPYSTAQVDAATQALLDLGVFASVDIVPTLTGPSAAEHVVPLTVKVEPTRLRQITLGGGAEIDDIKTDLHLVGKWEDHNFLGDLRDFSVDFRPGAVLYPIRIDNFSGTLHPLPEERTRFSLRQPGFIESRTTGFIRPEANLFPLLVEVDPPSNAPVIGYRELKVSAGLDRTFWKKLYASIDYNLQVEDPFAYVLDKDPALETLVLSFPELVLHLDFRDDAVRPHQGVYLGSTFQIAGGIFGGTGTDVRVQPEVRTYVPVARGVTFATRASIGFLWASNYGHDWNNELENSAATTAQPVGPVGMGAPTTARVELTHDTQIMYFRGFFSGGPVTNRGFPLLGVSPHGVVPFLNPSNASQQVQFGCDPTQPNFKATQCFLPVGGFTLWEFQNEMRFDIAGPLSGDVFCDMSDVSPQEGDIRLSHLHMSCGVGAAYDTPVGPIRLDIGYRVQPLQVLGYRSEADAAAADPVNGVQPTILGVPLAIAIGLGEAY